MGRGPAMLVICSAENCYNRRAIEGSAGGTRRSEEGMNGAELE